MFITKIKKTCFFLLKMNFFCKIQGGDQDGGRIVKRLLT